MEETLVSCISLTLLKHYKTKIYFLQVLNVFQFRFQIENSVSPGFLESQWIVRIQHPFVHTIYPWIASG